HQAGARYNLANSGILGCELSDLPLTAEDIALNGPNHEGYLPLKEAIAARYGTQPESVVTAQGTSMANFLAIATVIERGDEVLIEQPTYDPLLAAAEYLGATIKRFGRRFEDGYQIDPSEVEDLVSPRTRLIVMTSPHNPSAVAVEQATLQSIGEMAATRGIRVLVDEAYRDILVSPAPVAANLGRQFLSTSSLTKSHGLSGLRCGWILCEPLLAERMRRLNDLFGAVAPMPSDHLAVIAFRHIDALNERTRGILDPNLALVHRFLADHRKVLDCVVPQRSMMVFPRLRREPDSEALHDRLRRFDTSIVPGKFFEAPSHFRLGFAVRTEDVATGLGHLSRALTEA
ncbi:MAG: pyridoxal phosphate-dependent aminotransferase, partial [Acidobacteriota bacterium]